MLKSFFNLRISPSNNKVSYNNSIEQYRGLCALFVLLAHATAHEEILVDSFKWPAFIHYINSGYLSVVIFFCISGYVIGLSYWKNEIKITDYLKKRTIRLYPIYLFAIFLCLLVSLKVNALQLIGNVLFLQNSSSYFNQTVPVFMNFASWSLNYEVVYYLIFPIIFFIRPRLWLVAIILFGASLLFIHADKQTEFIANYINGFYFWIAGLIFAWIGNSSTGQKKIPLLSIAFLHLCQNHLGVGKIVLNTIGIHSNTNINWLFDLPFCILILGILTFQQGRFFRINKLFCYTVPAIVFIYLIATHRLFENERWVMCLLFWLLSLIFYKDYKLSSFFLPRLEFIGKISYALYILHIPVALLVKKWVLIKEPHFEIAIKYFLWIFLTFLFSYITEMLIQPYIKSYFFKKDAKTSVPVLSETHTTK